MSTVTTVTDEIRKTLSDPKPLYALAGAGDLAAEKLRDAPTLLVEAAGTVTTLATRLAAEAPERLAKVETWLAEVPGALDPRSVVATLDPRTARESIRDAVGKADPQVLRERAQSIALVQVGRVLEAAGKAVETYEGLAERGKTVVDRYLSSSDAKPSEVTVVVEQVVVDEPEAPAAEQAAKPEAKTEDAAVKEEAPAEAPKPQAKKTTSAPRKKTAAAPKTTKA
jgi:heparin binding hemagglutinin HbhA